MVNFRDSYFPVEWNLTQKRIKLSAWGKQYDTGRGFTVTVIDGGQVVTPTTEVLRLKWEKPDNTSGYVQATIINGKFIVENIDQMFTVAGSVRADFELSVAGEMVASITFYVNVEKAVAVDAVASSSEFTALQEAIATVDNITELNSSVASLGSDVDSLETQFNNVIANVTVDSEVIAARGTEPTLGARLDADKAEIMSFKEDYATLEGVTDKAVDYKKTAFFELDTTLNLFDGFTFISKNLMGSSPTMGLREVVNSKTAVVKIEPNTTYSIIKQSSGRFKVATDIIFNRSDNIACDGAVQWATSPDVTNYTFTSGANDVVLYIDVTSTNENVFIQVVEGVQAEFTIDEYPIKPKNLYIYSKNEVYSKNEINDILIENKGGIYVDARVQEVDFYVPTSKSTEVYLRYKFAHTIRPYVDGGLNQNDNQWRLIGLHEYKLVNGEFEANKPYPYLSDGEIECAIKVAYTPDFSGGFHGYEIMENGFMLVDGVYKELGAVFSGWVREITFAQNSNILKNGTVDDQIAHHSKYYEININGIKIKQKIKWLQSLNIGANYMGMLPIRRTSDSTINGIQLTDHFFSDYDYIVYDVSAIGHTNTQQRLGVETAQIWGNTSGINAIMSVKTKEEKGQYFFCSASDSYNKLYFSHTSEFYTTAIGEIWENETLFKIDVN